MPLGGQPVGKAHSTPSLSEINEKRTAAKLSPLKEIGKLDPHSAHLVSDKEAKDQSAL